MPSHSTRSSKSPPRRDVRILRRPFSRAFTLARVQCVQSPMHSQCLLVSVPKKSLTDLFDFTSDDEWTNDSLYVCANNISKMNGQRSKLRAVLTR